MTTPAEAQRISDAPDEPPSVPSPSSKIHKRGVALAIAALGVVFGDIATSPLYALKECFQGEHRVAPTPENILGVLSLVFWTLTLVVSVKYVTFIMRADNHGEGGILALLALVPPDEAASKRRGGRLPLLVLAVVFGAALLYGDGVITPAISVLSAVEGLEIATLRLRPAVIPLTIGILIALFVMQRRGTAGIGKVFGPAMLLWCITLAGLGVARIVQNPSIFRALYPGYAVSFFLRDGVHGFLILGAVVLCVTGVEALYADMGHFGPLPIRKSWFFIVFPAVLLNYFGQGAFLITNPGLSVNPFYAIVPSALLYPTVIIATVATIVASQALISGAFSLTHQAVQLGFFPRVTIVHTSSETEGQIYIPEINALLAVSCIGLVLAFKNSSALAAAYGIAVTGTMAITTVVYYVVMTKTWGWPVWRAAPLAGLFLVIDLSFFGSALVKFPDGGWFPLAFALGIYVVMMTWHTGRRYLASAMAEAVLPLQTFLDDVAETKPVRVQGTAVFMASNPHGVPPVLLHHFKHNQSLHKQIILLTVLSLHIPEAPRDEQIAVERLGEGFYRVTLKYGFMQHPNVPNALLQCKKLGLNILPSRTSYFLGRETLLPTGRRKMARWRKGLFAFISRNARPATSYFGLPPDRVVELGIQIDF
jgi:KUP system potassium uptake protein